MKFVFLIFLLLLSCKENSNDNVEKSKKSELKILVLGTAQDAGSPHIACTKECCSELFSSGEKREVVSLALIDLSDSSYFIFDASPDLPSQLKHVSMHYPIMGEFPDGVFLTHAHIGHYTGLMYFGREASGADNIPVYAMPKMKEFLTNNGPWSQLVSLANIKLKPLAANDTLKLNPRIKVIPLLVPHRDEFSETVGYKIITSEKSYLFIPDIDKWEKWELDISSEVKSVDYAFLDATFFDGEEINNRDLSEIPHPFVIESMEKFKGLSIEEKSKIVFIHLNHTNPLLNPDSEETKMVLEAGFKIARLGDEY